MRAARGSPARPGFRALLTNPLDPQTASVGTEPTFASEAAFAVTRDDSLSQLARGRKPRARLANPVTSGENDDPMMDETLMDSPHAGAFAPFEWMLSARYLRARRKEGFVSVIAGFSFLGIMLGVATLIIVMAVMNGFRTKLLGKILGFNGHIVAQPLETPLTDWKDVAARISQVEGVRLAVPVVDGPALASSSGASGVLVRGIRAADLNRLPSIDGILIHWSIATCCDQMHRLNLVRTR
jgi:hypothetical protein